MPALKMNFPSEAGLSWPGQERLYQAWLAFSRSGFRYEHFTAPLFEFFVVDADFDQGDAPFRNQAEFWTYYFEENLDQTRAFIDAVVHGRAFMRDPIGRALKAAIRADLAQAYDPLADCLADLEQAAFEARQAAEIKRWLAADQDFLLKIRQSSLSHLIGQLESRQSGSLTDLDPAAARQILSDLLTRPNDPETLFHVRSELAELYAQAGPFAFLEADETGLTWDSVYLTEAMRSQLAACFTPLLPAPVQAAQPAGPAVRLQPYPLFALHLSRTQTQPAPWDYQPQAVLAQAAQWNPDEARLRLQGESGRANRTSIKPAVRHADLPHDR